MKIAIIGATGQLGTDLVKVLQEDFSVLPLTHNQIEVKKSSSIKKALEGKELDILINTAAFHQVDRCEIRPREAFAVNAFGVRNLAIFCQQKNICLVHFSTDYVFGKDLLRRKPYQEDDLPGTVNNYGISKLAGEYFIAYLCQKYFLIRTAGLFGIKGPSGKGKNFVDLMLSLTKTKREIKVVDDQVSSHTFTLDLAKNVKALIKTKKYGLYHMVGKGGCSWYQFAKKIFQIAGKKVKVIPVTSKEFPTLAKRPKYSTLVNHNLQKIGLDLMPPWDEGLRRYLTRNSGMS